VKRAAAAAALAAVVCAGVSGAAAADGWRTVTDRPAGYAIAVPRPWQVVPASSTRLRALILRAAKAKRTALATQLAAVAAARKTAQPVYRFQAFAWPGPPGPVVPDVTVKTDLLTTGTRASALPRIAQQIVKALARSSAATASVTAARRLPAGRAMLVSGTMRLSKSVRSRYSVYLLIHGRTLFSLSFRGPRTLAEPRIVASFRFTR
jgi:hypothetical protein